MLFNQFLAQILVRRRKINPNTGTEYSLDFSFEFALSSPAAPHKRFSILLLVWFMRPLQCSRIAYAEFLRIEHDYPMGHVEVR